MSRDDVWYFAETGTPTRAQGSPPHGFKSRARVKPTPGPAPSPKPPPPPPARSAIVQWNGQSYVLPSYSVTIVDRSGSVLYQSHNTSAAPTTQRTFRPATAAALEWTCWSELDLVAERLLAEAVESTRPLEQLNLTRDRTEYLLYVTKLPKYGGEQQLQQQRHAARTLKLAGRVANAYSAFIDGKLMGSAFNAAHGYGSKSYSIALADTGAHQVVGTQNSSSSSVLTILSTSLGMHSHVTNRALDFKGIVGSVSLEGVQLLSSWWHVIGLAGEQWGAGAGNASLGWSECHDPSGPLTWRKAEFSIAAALLRNDSISVMLDVSGMSRGHFYLNGFDLGKYWTIGPSGQGPTQRYYQLPRSLLLSDAGEAKTNLLVLADELGALGAGSVRSVRVVFSTMEPVS
eukprot:COSAG02_NODE_522_length_20749_cov_14.985278_3_plen_401_part_00